MFRKKKYFLVRTVKIFLIFLLYIVLAKGILAQNNNGNISNPVSNPSTAYCEELGYEFIIKDTPEGQIGVCKISETIEAPAWEFLRGEEETKYSYCNQKGYESKIIDDPKKCGVAYKQGHGCLICVLKNGKEIETASLLKIEKTKKQIDICNNDGICSNQETTQNCPQDCVKIEQTINKINIKIIISIIVIAAVISIMILAYLFLIKPRNTQDEIYNTDVDNKDKFI